MPLRPLGVGEILDGTIGTLRRYWRPVLVISLAVAFVTELVVTVVTGLWFRDSTDLNALVESSQPSLDEISDSVEGSLGGLLVTSIVGLLGTVLTTALLTVIIGRAVLGRSATTADTWREARPQLPRMLGLTLVVPLLVSLLLGVCMLPGLLVTAAGATAGGSALTALGALAGLVGGVWLWIRLSLAAPALMLEKQGVRAALRRSAKLVQGSWWRVFGVQLLALALVFIISSIVQMPFTLLGLVADGSATGTSGSLATPGWPYLIVTGVGAMVVSTIALPFRANVTALLYLDQRIRREALDVELARAAGLPHYGDGPDPNSQSPG